VCVRVPEARVELCRAASDGDGFDRARLGSAEIFSSSSFVQHNFRARGLTASGAPHVTARRSV
jgi:hypothetical protein